MLEINEVALGIVGPDGERLLLSGVTTGFPMAHFAAIIGPSGCGKTTLLKLIAGIAPGEDRGTISWRGRDLEKEDFGASEIAYVPQFGIAHEELTVRECVRFALQLRVAMKNCLEMKERVDELLVQVGLIRLEGQRVKTLSGGQRRRLALAVELTSKPDVLLCDEVTSGLDPQAEEDIVQLLAQQANGPDGRLVLSVTHSLEHLDMYDSVLVMCRGFLAYHGPPTLLASYFNVDGARHLYARLEELKPEDWGAMWKQHRSIPIPQEIPIEPLPHGAQLARQSFPGPFSQCFTLLKRRLIVFARCRQQIALQVGLILGFPLLVTLFAWNGLPAIKNLTAGLDVDVLESLQEASQFLVDSSKIGSLVSGIAMFQVILLTLMGANNSGREVAVERPILELEKLAGLSPLAYVISKVFFLLILVSAQSIWMGLFVHHICSFPGSLWLQVTFLLLVNMAMTSICLAISSNMRSAEQSSLVSIYLVGFQLPLSGAILALPDLLGKVVRPLISAYWCWSGILETLKEERYYAIVQSVVQSPLTSAAVCVFVLAMQIGIGLIAAWLGCARRLLS